jgi:ankyrin repeat protein
LSELLQAVYEGDEARVAVLLAEDPELDVFEAAALGRTERLRELVDAEPELARAWAEDGFTPLHLAAFFRQPEAASFLLERGAEVDLPARNEMRVTPLGSAAAASNTETARRLLERGADPNARQEGGFTPIHAAAQNGNKELVDLLLAHDADPSLATDDGRTAAGFARDAGHEELGARLAASP